MSFLEYIKNKYKLILIYFLSTILAMVVILLGIINDGYSIPNTNIYYSVFLSSIILIIYLYLDYKKKKKFLDVLESSILGNIDLNNILKLEKDVNGEYELIRKYIINNYKSYMENLNIYKDQSELQNKFNNRWIHEMKTPVSVMKLIIENLKEENIDTRVLDEVLSLEEEVDKLKDGLEMSLYTLRVNDFKEDFKVERVNIEKLVRDVINENKSLFILNSVYPKNFVDEGLIVISDKKWLKFVLKQVITNAIKYTKVSDKESKFVKISVKRDRNETLLIIEDNGIGIRKKEISRVTDAFYTGSSGRKYFESTGMGLYLVKEVLDRLGHKLKIESGEDRFTKILITFSEGSSIYELN